MITFSHRGNFSKLSMFFQNLRNPSAADILERYGKLGVDALRSATPIDTGLTADSWYYQVNQSSSGMTLSFHNSNINHGVPIAIILQYGHGTRNGGWVQGVDYINPALVPIFDELSEKVWKEVTSSERSN